MIAENATLLEGAERFQVVGSKHKEVISRDKEGHWSSKKAKEKYCRGNAVKMRGANPYKRCVHTGQDCLVHNSR